MVGFVGVLVMAIGVIMPAGAPSATAATAPAVRSARTAATVTLADSAGTPSVVERLSLPAGSWTVTSTLTAVDLGQGDFVTCRLTADGSAIDGGQDVYLGGRLGGVVNVGTVVARAPLTVAVACSHDFDAVSAGQFSVKAGAVLLAVKGGPIRAPGISTAGSPVVVEARTGSAVSVPKGAYKAVTSVSVPRGTWAVTANVSAYNFATDFSAFDFAACRVDGGAGASVSSNVASAGTNETDTRSTGLDLEATATVSTSRATLVLRCGSTLSDTTSIVDGATLTATKVTPAAVRQATMSQVSLAAGPGQWAPVEQTSMPAGAWRVRTAVSIGNRLPNNSYGVGQDVLRCRLRANGTQIDGGSAVLITKASNIQGLVDAGTFTAAAPWTLTLSCSHDAANSTGGTWTVLYGSLVAVDQGPISGA